MSIGMLIYVKWEDHCSNASWIDPADLDADIIVCETFGFLIQETRKFITVSHTKMSNEDYCGYIKILKSCILERNEIIMKGYHETS